MIHLDTNALIALPHWLRAGHRLVERVESGERVAACAVVWYEFLSGPVDGEEIRLAAAFIEQRVVALDGEHATLAAHLFNQAGRKRSLKTDALIAAAAIRDGAELLTVNVRDFQPFVRHGLRLAAGTGI